MKPLEGVRVVCWAEHPEALGAAADILSGLGCQVQSVRSTEELRRALSEAIVDLVLAHLSYCFREPLEFLRSSDGSQRMPPFLVASSAYDVSLYMEAMRQGAFDCVGLPVDEKELVRIASRALDCPSWQAASCGG